MVFCPQSVRLEQASTTFGWAVCVLVSQLGAASSYSVFEVIGVKDRQALLLGAFLLSAASPLLRLQLRQWLATNGLTLSKTDLKTRHVLQETLSAQCITDRLRDFLKGIVRQT